jgi:c-di-GMP-binding flagellar brake protein YcgR
MDYDSAFLIHNSENIIGKLSILLKSKCLITVYYGDNDDSFLTTILDIYIENRYLTFYHGPKEDLIEQLLGSHKITFKTEYAGIKVAFEALKIAKIQHQGVPIFVIPVPESMLWVETRDFYRVKSPDPKSSYCQLTRKDQEPINLKLYDISLSGLSVLNACSEVSALMAPDTHVENCKLVLADTGEDSISFHIGRSRYIVNPEQVTRMEKIGCKFTRITPVFETAIQRYMQRVEKESRQKK